MRQNYFTLLLLLTCTGALAQNKVYRNSVYAWFKNGYSETLLTETIKSTYKVRGINPGFPDAEDPRLKNTVIIDCDCNAEEFAAAINRTTSSDIFAEPVPYVEPLYTPNDSAIVTSLPSCGQSLPFYHLDLIQANKAWDYSTGSPSVKLAIIDQGFNPNHPDFVRADGSSQVLFWDSLSTNPVHGTFVAGCAAAATDNQTGIQGIGFNTSLMLYSTYGSYNSILSAVNAGAKVVNLSWGGMGQSQTEQIVMNEVYKKGVVVVAAAGNGAWGITTTPYYPASYNHVISVTSIGPNDNHEHYYLHQNDNCTQKSMIHQHNTLVDIAAPGYEIISTWSGGGYGISSGTSFASPIVAGTVALMLSANPLLSPDDVENILKCSADNIDPLNPFFAGLLGAGRLNAGEAVRMAHEEEHHGKLFLEAKPVNQCSTGNVMIQTYRSGGVHPFRYTWNGIEGSDVLEVSQPGQYIVTVSDHNCMTFSDTILIEEVYSALGFEGNKTWYVCPEEEIEPFETLRPVGGSGHYSLFVNEVEMEELVFHGEVGKSDTLNLRVADKETGCNSMDFLILKPEENCNELTSVEENKNENTRIFPNPSAGYFVVEVPFAGKAQIVIYSVSGQRILEQGFHGKYVSTETLAPGMYIVKVKGESGITLLNEKLIIQ